MPFTVICAPGGSEVIRNSPSVASTSPTLTGCASFSEATGSVASSVSPALARTVSVAATSAIGGVAGSGVIAPAVVTGTSSTRVVVPARYHAVATAQTAPRTTSAAALDHNAVENGDEPASPRGTATASCV